MSVAKPSPLSLTCTNTDAHTQVRQGKKELLFIMSSTGYFAYLYLVHNVRISQDMKPVLNILPYQVILSLKICLLNTMNSG